MNEPVADLQLDLTASPNPLDLSILERGLFRFEETRLGNPQPAHFSIFLRDSNDEVRGGIDAHILWNRLFIKTLWISERFRGQGHGSKLVQAVEAEAIRRQCRSLWLTALGDRACHFYLRLDFRVYGAHDDYVGGQNLYSLRKDL